MHSREVVNAAAVRTPIGWRPADKGHFKGHPPGATSR